MDKFLNILVEDFEYCGLYGNINIIESSDGHLIANIGDAIVLVLKYGNLFKIYSQNPSGDFNLLHEVFSLY